MQWRWYTAGRLALLAILCTLSACMQQPAPTPAAQTPVPVDGIGYMVFNAPIANQSRDLFIADVDKFIAAGAKEMRIGINSPGGEIDAAQGMVDYMARVHSGQGITFKVYNVGLVASAASYVFLSGQNRFANRRSVFLFHAPSVTSSGPVTATAPMLRDAANKLERYERTVREMLKARTRLSENDARIYMQRAVVLNADDAQRDGIVDEITDFTLPKGARAWTIAAVPRPKPAQPATSAPPVPN